MEICANGIPQHLTELTQQILWIGSALNFSASSEQIAYSEAVIGQGPSCLNISFRNTALHPTENPCWLPLFSGATIARNFPIPERQDQTGLEIPIDIMAGIAGVRHAVEYAGGVVMKGFSSMFVPIERLGNLVQWHLISSSDCDTRLSYKDVLERCKNRATLKDVSLDSLRTTRAIVGWCNTASTTLGSALANYENLDYSGAKDAESSLKCAGGTLGFQQFGVAQADFSFGPKDGKCHFQRNGPYESIVKIAEKTPVTLYDTAENRAWLVPASSVILHIAQHRNWLEPFQVDGQRVNLFSSLAKCSSIRDILLRNASIELSDYERYTFKDMVTNIWSLLEFLLDQNVRIDRTAGGAIEKPCQDILKGFEFKAVVEELSPFRQKQAKIKKTCGGWPTLVRDIDALVLFANGFEDLILPLEDESADLCRLWQRVPKGQDYLATSVKTLTDLYNVAGCRTSRAYLTSTELQWHRGTSTLFEPCKNPGAYRCECVRLQRILPKSATGTIIPPGSLTEAKDGAVIFGHSSTVLQTLKPTFKVPSTKGLFTQPNIPLTPVIVGQDSDEGLTDGETVGQTDSDGTGITPSSSITSYTNEDESSNQDVSMTGLELEPRGSRKRRWPPDESGDSLMAPQRKCQFLEPNKRTKNTTPSREMNPGCRVFGGSQKSPEPSTLGPGNETYSCQFGDPTCLKSPPQLRVLKKQTAQTFDRRYTQREP
ncbi:hypothetical protein BU16DRAFT_134693 [Lophium mytilinum]|uniref:Uncharacterized protein n=1 Tax=Lophium mytilinum TaxID=390894 RepID=A0A6A6QFK5_9PEZI|nr:hypothetical protein BU16DRAFT_134693 [Lophium mytilinum]